MSRPLTVRVVGVGMGSQHVTPEAAAALARSAYVVAAEKSADDPLLALRREIAAAHGLEVVAVPDPTRDRDDPADYPGAVRDWHAARAAAYAEVVAARGGDPAFLVWGDPSLYDSTIRVARLMGPDVRVEVVAGVGAPQLLAARCGIVLHDVGRPVHVTTERRLGEAITGGQTNVVVMLTSGPPPAGADGVPDDWCVWWGADLGTEHESLVHGRLGDVRERIAAERERVRAAAGWVMDTYLVRAPGTTP
ncbi:SAM-dependent methyltransferase [Nocardioides litoris]|uniref:SAM-dependent methyltransferase n=1 Tax=Nocardioides litoris TaxID=1926648 RepID=UPI001FEADEC4|nr:SAM-dependent methyltransferase [Nocardioides litoris]